MAHECPVCGMTCHCNGDIDDICLDLEGDILACTHCPDCENIEVGSDCCPYDEPNCPDCEGCDCCPYDETIY